MKEQVADISKVLQGITEDMRLLRETINQQYSEIVRLNLNIYALSLQISKLKIILKYSYTFHFDFGVDTFLEVYWSQQQLRTTIKRQIILFRPKKRINCHTQYIPCHC